MTYKERITIPVVDDDFERVLDLKGIRDVLTYEYNISKYDAAGVTVTIRTEKGREDEMTKQKKKLNKEEKRKLLQELAGSAKHFSYEGLKESDRIANRGDWEEYVK